MSSREPLWFCHECSAEMRPLMMPHPVCASCRSDFVEKMEDPADDPREFTHGGDFVQEEIMGPGIETFLLGLQQLLDRGIVEGRPSTRSAPSGENTSNGFSFQIRTGSGSRPTSGGLTGSGIGQPPTMSEFLRGPDHATTGGTITGPLMAQYLMALLGQRPGDDAFGLGDPATRGRMGDYVFNQEALDHIITQLMNESNVHRPVPATEEIVSNLPREILQANSPTLEKDCAVCKDPFKLDTEDPDEQITITLPCKHPFHEHCILPWLKSSGTCPVCRYALVPQPEHHPLTPASERGSPNNGPGNPPLISNRSPRQDTQHDTSGFLQSLFGGLVGGGRTTASGSSRHNRSNSDPASQSRSRGNGHLPGGWSDDLD